MLPKSKITIFDTTMRDGELMPGVSIGLEQKLVLAQLLEEMHVDVIEVGYPSAFPADFDAVAKVSAQVKESIVCGLASTREEEITSLAAAIKPAAQGRLHLYTLVNLKFADKLSENQTLDSIRTSVSLARNACPDVEWSAFDASRSQPDFLYRAIEGAIASGATTISIPDSFGTLSSQEFSELIRRITHQVPNIDQATLSVHCHDDRGLAVENSLAALDCGARQIECAINGLGARKGNAALEEIVTQLSQHPDYEINVEVDLLNAASELVEQITGVTLDNRP